MPHYLLVQEIQHRKALHLAQLTFYQTEETNYLNGDWQSELKEDAAELQFMYLTLKRGVAYETSWLTWCDEVLAVLNQANHRSSSE